MANLAVPGLELGSVLVQVQEDLHNLKKKLRDVSDDWETVDAQSLEAAIERTESGLRKHTEKYLNTVNRSVLTVLPADSRDLHSRPISRWGVPLEPSQKEITFPKMAGMVPPGDAALPSSLVSKRKLSMMMKIMCDPRHVYHRSVLNQNYGISLPLINKRKTALTPTQKIAKGMTVDNLAVAPPSFHLNNIYSTLPVSARDAEKGILSLTERGLIPRAARLTLEKPPLLLKAIPLHEFQTKYKKLGTEVAAQSRKEEMSHTSYQMVTKVSKTPVGWKRGGKGSIAPPPSCISLVSSRRFKQQQLFQALRKKGLPPPASLQKTSEAISAQSLENVVFEIEIPVCKGSIDYTSPELLQFKQRYCFFWSSIFSFLEQVASLMKDYAVPSAIIREKKVMELVPDFELNQRLTREELLSVIKNVALVQKYLSQPGRRYKGRNGPEMAATKIQATWRGYKLRKAYIGFRQRQWASGIIAITWLIHVHLRRVRKTLQESRQRHLESFYIRAKHLAANWNRIRTSRRTIIHIPSLGYAQSVREANPDFAVRQGSQIGRLCEIRDSNVDVIYICPLQLSEEMLGYYSKLLGLQPAVQSGNPKDIGDLQDRFKILTPEAINSFPNRPMSLASFLKYSPKTIKRVRNLIQGREAYIVGGLLNQDDLEVADALGVPILGSAPDVAHLYSSKSGNKRVFAGAGVPVPPGQYDIYSRQQMVEVLSNLIIDYPEVKRWVFKVDNEFGGNGTAFCDITEHLKCYPWILKEIQRYGPEMWKKRWAHEPALVKLSQEVPSLLAQHAHAVNKKRFPTWGKFLQTFVSQGGIIEAFPPSDSITNLTVDMLIEPTGEITMVSCGDQFHADGPLRSSGATLPQSSVEPQLLYCLCLKIGDACKARGVVGYFSIDFATFIHPKTMKQQVWAIDLDLHYSDHLAMTQVMLYLTQGTFDCKSSRFEVQLIPKGAHGLCRQEEQGQSACVVSRSVILSSSIRNTSLSFIYYSVFLQMCLAHGIGYDVQLKEGTVFTLFEDQKRDTFGIITIGEHLQEVLMTFAHHLFIIYQELSVPYMDAETNFKGAVQDIERILGVTEQNKLKFEEEAGASKG